MEKRTSSDPHYDCGLEAAVDVVGGKWKPLILWALADHPHRRFGELRRDLGAISEKVLARQLKDLERDGIVERVDHREMPLRVTYDLTARGLQLYEALAPLGEWGETNMAHIVAVRS